MQITNQSRPPPESRYQSPSTHQRQKKPRLTRLLALAGPFRELKRRIDGLFGAVTGYFGARLPSVDSPLHGPVEIGGSRVMSIVLHFAKLDAEDRTKRFNGRMTLASLVDRYTKLDERSNSFIGFQSKGRVVALAELSAMDDRAEGGLTEVGISVLKPWQQRGLGEALLREVTDRVCEKEGRDLVLFISPRNRGMAHLTYKLGGERVTDSEEPMYRFRGKPRDTAQLTDHP